MLVAFRSDYACMMIVFSGAGLRDSLSLSHTHTHTLSLSLSLSLCVCVSVYQTLYCICRSPSKNCSWGLAVAQ